MFRKTAYIFLLSAFLSVMSQQAQATSLQETVLQAVQTNPVVKADASVTEAAEHFVDEQRAGFFPTLSVNARVGRIHSNDDTTRANTADNAGDQSWMGEGGVTLTQPLYTGFGLTSRYAAAKDRREAADYELGSTVEDIALRAVRAHLNVMRMRELLDLARHYETQMQERKNSIELMVNEGAGDEAELLQGEEILLLAQNNRLGYEDALLQAETEYMEVVGQIPSDTLVTGDLKLADYIPVKVDDAVTYGLRHNPAIMSADRLVSALGLEAKAEKSTLSPRFDAELSYLQKDQKDNLSGELENAQAVVKMSWNFSTGGAQKARIQRGLKQRDEALAQYQAEIRRVEKMVRQKYNAMMVLDKQLDKGKEREETNEKILDSFLSQFEGGQRSNLQLISAQSRLLEAKADRINAFYRSRLARYELLQAMGMLNKAMEQDAQVQKAAVE